MTLLPFKLLISHIINDVMASLPRGEKIPFAPLQYFVAVTIFLKVNVTRWNYQNMGLAPAGLVPD